MTMDVRKATNQPLSRKAEARRSWIKFAGIREEFRRISWTSKAELKVATKAVVYTTLLVGLGIYAVDLVIQGSLSCLGALARLVIGG